MSRSPASTLRWCIVVLGTQQTKAVSETEESSLALLIVSDRMCTKPKLKVWKVFGEEGGGLFKTQGLTMKP